jgi:Family of unknown function (DUF5681)
MFVKGKSGNVKGRPKGIIDKRQRMQKAIGEGADALINVIKARALEGDMQAAALLISRLVPTLKPEGAPVRFEHDTTLSPSKQIESVLAAIAAGQLTVEEGLHLVKAIESLANTRALEGGGDSGLIDAFKGMAQAIAQRDGMSLPAPKTSLYAGIEDPQAALPPVDGE